jgi:hypothetical protein
MLIHHFSFFSDTMANALTSQSKEPQNDWKLGTGDIPLLFPNDSNDIFGGTE